MILALDGICLQVDRSFQLRNISLQVSSESCLAVMGPSGSGKTLTLRVIAGLERPDSGRILIDGKNPSRRNGTVAMPPGLIGMVFQGLALWPHMTVAQNVFFGINSDAIPKRQRRGIVNELLTQLGIGDHGNRYPMELSGGERQRVALARALINRPRILLLDEPMVSLDFGYRREIIAILSELKQKEKIGLVYVTHDRREVELIADSIVILSDGLIVERGDAPSLLSSPQTPIGQRLLQI
jgi:ABC-type sulfate/molybdate transport systems ATPase subunit